MNPLNIAFLIGNTALTWNSIMLALGILVAVVVSGILVKKRGAYKDLALDACIIGIPAGLIGGRLFSALSGKIAFSAFFDLTQNGLNLPGALLFIGVGITIWLRIKKISVDEAFDILTPGAFFGLAVGRWSDFFLCDGLGAEVGANLPKFFPLATFTPQYFSEHSTVAYAVFFLDFLVCLALGVAALLMMDRKNGRVYRLSIILYLFAEFILEWLRVEWPEVGFSREIVFGEVRFNQIIWIAMLLFFAGLSLYRAKHPVTANAVDADPKPDEEEPAEAEQPDENEPIEASEQPDDAADEAADQPEEEPDETEQPDEDETVEAAEQPSDAADEAEQPVEAAGTPEEAALPDDASSGGEGDAE